MKTDIELIKCVKNARESVEFGKNYNTFYNSTGFCKETLKLMESYNLNGQSKQYAITSLFKFLVKVDFVMQLSHECGSCNVKTDSQIGEFFDKVRINIGLSEVEFDEKTGLGEKFLYNLKRGKKINVKNFLNVINVLGCEFDFLKIEK